jgi:dUTP pyrophosphatase
MLKVKKLHPDAIIPTCSRPGEDIAFDLYALENTELPNGRVVKVRTGVAVEMEGHGFLVCDRSSMAAKNLKTSGGVIDAGYRGEMFVNLTFFDDPTGPQRTTYQIKCGDKIGQFVPQRVKTAVPIVEVAELSTSDRGAKGYGSSGR